jgi:predicted DNA-binding transcriptional regulator AlpA
MKATMKLLRRRDVINRLGITRHQLDKMISTGLIKPIRKRGCRAWFRSADLEAI